MAILTRWDPFSDLGRLQDDMWGGLFRASGERGYLPALDVHEDKDAFHVKVDLPGIKNDDVKVSVENQTLTIFGDRKEEKERTEDGARIKERRYGSFSRSLSLPESADGTKISAHLKDGVLNVTIPKKAEVKPKLIDVKIG